MANRSWDEMRGATFDSREIIDRIGELEYAAAASPQHDALDEDEAAELAILRDIEAQAGAYGDWQYGETFIPESDFEDYARQLADDIGAIDRKAPWPTSYIDWAAAADALRMDYTSYTFDGIDYLARS